MSHSTPPDDSKATSVPEKLPQMSDLHGIDITGGMESSEYVRMLRDTDDDWQPSPDGSHEISTSGGSQ